VPLIPVEVVGPDDEIVIIPMREPPVCGEWSYADEELEEPRFVARRIDGIAAPTSKATPIHPIRAINPMKGAGAPVHVTPSEKTPVAAPAPAVTGKRAPRQSLESLRLAFERSPADTTTALIYISTLEKRADAETALRVIDRAIEAGADLFAMTCARASALGARLKYDDAEKAIRAADRLRPDAPEVLLQTGILACRRARWRDAIEPLERAAALAPDNAVVHYHVGEALNHADRLPGALAAYERAAELEPENWRAIKGIGIVLDRLGRPADAANAYRRARDVQNS